MQFAQLPVDDWQYEPIGEVDGVKLVEIGVGVYMIEYQEGGYLRQPVFYSWPEAQANWLRRIAEVA